MLIVGVTSEVERGRSSPRSLCVVFESTSELCLRACSSMPFARGPGVPFIVQGSVQVGMALRWKTKREDNGNNLRKYKAMRAQGSSCRGLCSVVRASCPLVKSWGWAWHCSHTVVVSRSGRASCRRDFACTSMTLPVLRLTEDGAVGSHW